VDLSGNTIIKNVETFAAYWDVSSFNEKETVIQAVRELGRNVDALEEIPMNLEDAFIGCTGRF
jgi:hypothetical protein